MEPWQNDPVVSQANNASANAAPWQNDPVVQAPKPPNMGGVAQMAEDNIAANDNKSVSENGEQKPPLTPAQRLDVAAGMSVGAMIKGDDRNTPIPEKMREHLMNAYADGSASTSGDFFQSALHAIAPLGGPLFEKAIHPVDTFNEIEEAALGGGARAVGTLAYPFLSQENRNKLIESGLLGTAPDITGGRVHDTLAKGLTRANALLSPGIGAVYSVAAPLAPLMNIAAGDVQTAAENFGASKQTTGLLSQTEEFAMNILGGAALHPAARGAIKSAIGPWDNHPGADVVKQYVGEALDKKPAEVSSQEVDQTIAKNMGDKAPAAKDFEDVGAVTEVVPSFLRKVYKETGVRPDQVFEDMRNSPKVAAEIDIGKIPEAYDHLLEQPKPSAELRVVASDTAKAFNVVDTDGDYVHGGFDSAEEAREFIEERRAGAIPDEPPEWGQKAETKQDVFPEGTAVASPESMYAGVRDKIEGMSDDTRDLRLRLLNDKMQAGIIKPREMAEREALSEKQMTDKFQKSEPITFKDLFKNEEGSGDTNLFRKGIGESIKLAEKTVGKLTGDLFPKLAEAYVKTFQPELVGDKALRADAYLAKYKTSIQEAENSFYRRSAAAKAAFDKMSSENRMQWLYDHETGRWNEKDNPDHARYQTLLDSTFKQEKAAIGADADKGYKENYLPHSWEKPDAVKAFFNSDVMLRKYGKDGFTKASTFQLIQDGVRAGFKLKTDNPESMLVARLTAGHDMIATMNLLKDMESSGLAKPTKVFSVDKRIAKLQSAIDEAQKKYDAASEKVNDPKQMRWDFADPAVSKYMKDVQARIDALKEKLDAANEEKASNNLSPEDSKDLKTAGFKIIGPDSKVWNIQQQVAPLWKNVMESKGLWEREGTLGNAYRYYTGVKALWTQVKLGLSLFHPVHVAMINLASGAATAAEHLIQGGKISDLSWKDTGASMGLTENTLKAQDHPAVKAWNTLPEERTPEQQNIVTTMIEGGFKPTLSARDTVHVKENFNKAINGVGLNNLRLIGTAISLPGLVMKPFFEHWIPGMKSEVYLRRAQMALDRDPSLATDAGRRGEVYRQIAKDVDHTYGEMNNDVQFWNKTVRDSFNASFISGGWKLAQIYNARGLLQPLKIAYNFAKTGEFSKADITYNMLHAYAYTGLTLALGGMINKMLGNPIGTAKDTTWDIVKNLVFPQTGEKNSDGTPIRLNQPAFAKDAYMLARDINTKGLISGAGSFLYHQTLLPGIVDTLNGRDFTGKRLISDPTDLHQWTSAGWDFIAPISISTYERAEAKGSKVGQAAGLLGFPIAGAYVNQTPFEQKVLEIYYEQNPPKGNVYETKLKGDLKEAIREKDFKGIKTIEKKMTDEGMTEWQIEKAKTSHTDPFVETAWSKLDAQDQKRLLESASREEKTKFKVKSQ